MPPPGQEARAPDRARPEAAPVAQPTVTQPPTVEVKGVPEIVKRIDAAIAAGQNSALAALYLDLAHGYEKLGNVEARLSALRSAAGCGSLHGPRSCHAAARLELAEIAYAAGDLTSACEQWQLARIAFLEDDQTEQFARVEKRMRENGCPTDWVLTDF
jgi:tetratricopeptide (TPR) repeat protein